LADNLRLARWLELNLAWLNRNKLVVVVLKRSKDLSCFCDAQGLHICELAVHIVLPKVSLAHDSLFGYHEAFALLAVVRPLSIINFLRFSIVVPASTVLLALLETSDVNIASRILQSPDSVLRIVRPAALIHIPFNANQLALTFLYKSFMLAVVNVTRTIKQFADFTHYALLKGAFKYDIAL
jgi:hypothetical protein